jgi:hypothetical protein
MVWCLRGVTILVLFGYGGLFWSWLSWRGRTFMIVRWFGILRWWRSLSEMNFVGKIVMYRFIVGWGATVVSAFSFCLFVLAFVNGMMYDVRLLFGFRVVVGRSRVGIWKFVLYEMGGDILDIFDTHYILDSRNINIETLK